MISQFVQIIGSLLILVAFILLQTRRVKADTKTYLVLNLAGSLILGVNAIYEQQLGFILLEAVWAGVSAIGLVRAIRSPHPAPTP